MLGYVFFFVYLCLGVFWAHILFSDKRAFIRIWIGCVFGIVALMWSHVPFSFLFGFTKLSHALGLLLFIGVIAVCGLYKKKKRGCFPHPFRGRKKKFSKSEKLLVLVLFPFLLFAVVCLINHTLYNVEGNYLTGQCTYGDMNFHLGIITSIAEQGTFPPDYSIFPGAKLDYYFLCDSVSSSLLIFGSDLQGAYILPMLFGFALTFCGFWFLADSILKNRKKTLIAFLLFFLNGGFGTMYFLTKGESSATFHDLFFGYYQTPTNYRAEGNIIWTNAIVDMMLPQRATLFGWMVICVLFYLLYSAVFKNERKNFLIAGILGGLTPMIQTYTFFTLGMVALAWMIYSLVKSPANRRLQTFLDWVKFGVPAVVLAVPQFLIWIFSAVGSDSFLLFQFNAYNEGGDMWLWFWIKNVGLVFLLIPFAFAFASKKMRAVYSGAIVLFVVAECIVFQTHAYDNNKIFFMWHLFSSILVGGFAIDMYNKIKAKPCKPILAVLFLVICTNAAILTAGRELISGFPIEGEIYCGLRLYDESQVKACEYISENTESDSMFLTYYNHNNAVSSLTGRNIYCGSATFLYSHGVDYSARQALIDQMFTNSQAFEENKEVCGIDYVYISSTEQGNIQNLIEEYFDQNYETVYYVDGVKIYDVR